MAHARVEPVLAQPRITGIDPFVGSVKIDAKLRILVKLATNNASKLAGDNASTCPLQKELQAES